MQKASDRPRKPANLPTCYPREAGADLLPLSKPGALSAHNHPPPASPILESFRNTTFVRTQRGNTEVANWYAAFEK